MLYIKNIENVILHGKESRDMFPEKSCKIAGPLTTNFLSYSLNTAVKKS